MPVAYIMGSELVRATRDETPAHAIKKAFCGREIVEAKAPCTLATKPHPTAHLRIRDVQGDEAGAFGAGGDVVYLGAPRLQHGQGR